MRDWKQLGELADGLSDQGFVHVDRFGSVNAFVDVEMEMETLLRDVVEKMDEAEKQEDTGDFCRCKLRLEQEA